MSTGSYDCLSCEHHLSRELYLSREYWCARARDPRSTTRICAGYSTSKSSCSRRSLAHEREGGVVAPEAAGAASLHGQQRTAACREERLDRLRAAEARLTAAARSVLARVTRYRVTCPVGGLDEEGAGGVAVVEQADAPPLVHHSSRRRSFLCSQSQSPNQPVRRTLRRASWRSGREACIASGSRRPPQARQRSLRAKLRAASALRVRVRAAGTVTHLGIHCTPPRCPRRVMAAALVAPPRRAPSPF